LTRQRFLLDPLRALSYIGAGALVLSCRPRFAPLVPDPLSPATAEGALEWTRTTLPRGTEAIRFHWRYRDERMQVGGRGTARIAPPDSMRFDYAGPLNMGQGAAVVIGDSVRWADPADNFRSLVPAVPMLWVALGTVRPPAPGATVYGGGDSTRRLWRFVQGADTLEYAMGGAPLVLDAQWRRGGQVVAVSHTTFDDHARPLGARVDFPEAKGRFELTVVAVDTTALVPPALWRGRR